MDLIVDENVRFCDHLIIMDDDLGLSRRRNPAENPIGFEDLTHEGFDEMIDELRQVTTYEVPLASVQYRQFSNIPRKSVQYCHNHRISMIWCMNARFFQDHPQFRFYRSCGLPFLEDYFFFMNLLVHGHPNICINRFTKDDRPNAPGGVREKRTAEVFNQSVLDFAALFPRYVTVREKTGKTNWKDGLLGVSIRAPKLYRDVMNGTYS